MANIEIEELERDNAIPIPDNPAAAQNVSENCDLLPVALTTLLPLVVYLKAPKHWKSSEDIVDKLECCLPSKLRCLGQEPVLKNPIKGMVASNWDGVHAICLQHANHKSELVFWLMSETEGEGG